MARGIRSSRTTQWRDKKHIEETTTMTILKEGKGMVILAEQRKINLNEKRDNDRYKTSLILQNLLSI